MPRPKQDAEHAQLADPDAPARRSSRRGAVARAAPARPSRVRARGAMLGAAGSSRVGRRVVPMRRPASALVGRRRGSALRGLSRSDRSWAASRPSMAAPDRREALRTAPGGLGPARLRPRGRETLALGRMENPPPTPPRRPRTWPATPSTACPRARSTQRLRRGPAAARQARARPDGARPPPRPHGRADEAARVPGRRPHRRADRRRLHRARGGSVRALGHAAGARRARRSTRNARDLPAPGGQGAAVDDERLEVRRNSEWLDMPMEDLFRLARHPTVAQLLERDDFAKRFAADEPISLLELLYPVLQGYDSVAVERRRRARRHRPDVQPADGPRDPAGLRPGAAGRADACRC